jgi:hypothetical protein
MWDCVAGERLTQRNLVPRKRGLKPKESGRLNALSP